MARPGLAAATATFTLLIAASPALATPSHKGARCASAHGAATPAPRSGTRSYRQSHCVKHGAHRRRHRRGKPAHFLFFAPHDGVCPDATMQPAASNTPQIRAATLCLVNRERAAHGERALHWNAHLVASAQGHTESMAFGDYFEHLGPGGQTPLSRMRRDGYIYSSRLGFEVAENIGWGSLWLGTPRAVVAAWMASPGHRANILDGRFRDTGIGVSPHTNGLANGQSGGIYTQDFGVIVG
jgi:uncharacterized protein YkwD